MLASVRFGKRAHDTIMERMAPRERFPATTIALIGLAVLSLASVLHTVFGANGLLRWFELKRDVARLAEENQALREENERLKEEAQRLASDPRAIERAIREELDYVKPGEIVFKFASGPTARSEKSVIGTGKSPTASRPMAKESP